MLMDYASEAWTLEQLHRLPDDGNRYELLDGELFVTPPPSPSHELLGARLRSVLEPFVRSHKLGDLFTPRAVVRMLGCEVEPDLMLLPAMRVTPESWEDMPAPTLVVEVLSRTTSRRDQIEKRAYYQRIGVAEYWIVDGASRTVQVVRQGADDMFTGTRFTWRPEGTNRELVVDVGALFRGVFG